MKYKNKNKIAWFLCFFSVFFGAFGSVGIGVLGMKFKATLECEIEVDFSDKEKAQAYFIDGDWKEYFYTFDGLDEFTRHLVYAFNESEEMLRGGRIKFVEGIGEFIHDRSKNEWRLTHKNLQEGESFLCGQIVIRYVQDTHCSTLERV